MLQLLNSQRHFSHGVEVQASISNCDPSYPILQLFNIYCQPPPTPLGVPSIYFLIVSIEEVVGSFHILSHSKPNVQMATSFYYLSKFHLVFVSCLDVHQMYWVQSFLAWIMPNFEGPSYLPSLEYVPILRSEWLNWSISPPYKRVDKIIDLA
jgi:hypothetical protein